MPMPKATVATMVSTSSLMKAFWLRFPVLVRHAGVIGRDAIALSGQGLSHFIDVGAPDAVDDAGFARVTVQHIADLFEGFVRRRTL